MAFELIYTSVERGLRPGSSGYCTVAHSRGLPPTTVKILESLSTYKSLYSVHEEHSAENPVSYSHYTSSLLGHGSSVLSRITPSGADHTGRSNKLAHHILLQSNEYAAAGPLWLSQQEGFFLENWQDKPRIIEEAKTIPDPQLSFSGANSWAELCGDAGYASLLARDFITAPTTPVFVIFSPGMPMLSLLAEAAALLPVAQRWKITYNTYFSSLPVGVTCLWRCCVQDSDIIRDIRRNPQSKVYDLTGELPPPQEDKLTELARNGYSDISEIDKAKDDEKPQAPKRKFVLLPRRDVNMLSLKPRKKEN